MDTIAASALRECFIAILKIGGPVMCATLIIGLLVSVIQAVTQINEATLSFLPKVGVVVLVFFLLGPFFVEVMNIFSVRIFDHIVTVGGT